MRYGLIKGHKRSKLHQGDPIHSVPVQQGQGHVQVKVIIKVNLRLHQGHLFVKPNVRLNHPNSIVINALNPEKTLKLSIQMTLNSKEMNDAYSSQSTAMIRLISLVGNPTAVNTRSMVTNPALGTLAAPILARVAVKLQRYRGGVAFTWGFIERCRDNSKMRHK